MGLDAYSTTRKNFPRNSFPLPQRKPSLVPELACTIRNMVNAIHRSVPVQSSHVAKTIPSWNRRLLAETASWRNLFRLNTRWLDRWDCRQTNNALNACRRSISRMLTIDRSRCLFNNIWVVASRFVTSLLVLKRFSRVEFCLRSRPVFCQSSLGSDRYHSANLNERVGCYRVEVVFGSIIVSGDILRDACSCPGGQ